jgi:hypothetical protein
MDSFTWDHTTHGISWKVPFNCCSKSLNCISMN